MSPWFPVPPKGYGGIELMVYNLARGLHDAGHQVTVIGRQGSHGPFESLALAPESWEHQLGTRDHEARQDLFLFRAYDIVRRRAFDVVHDHSGFPGIMLAAACQRQAPVVATIHGALTEAEGDFLGAVDRRVHLVAISRAQQSQVAGVEWRGCVHNAVDPDVYHAVTRHEDKEGYLLVLARVSATKGQHTAIEVAKRLNMPLVMAGKIDEDSKDYFEEKIKPELNERITWRENVEGKEKVELLARASALLFPIEWEEPFGIAMVEAMVSGTPVIAMAHGAASELVENGLTGYVVEDIDGMVEAYSKIKDIDLEKCVAEAARRFGPKHMAEGYLTVYERAIKEAQHSEPI